MDPIFVFRINLVCSWLSFSHQLWNWNLQVYLIESFMVLCISFCSIEHLQVERNLQEFLRKPFSSFKNASSWEKSSSWVDCTWSPGLLAQNQVLECRLKLLLHRDVTESLYDPEGRSIEFLPFSSGNSFMAATSLVLVVEVLACTHKGSSIFLSLLSLKTF